MITKNYPLIKNGKNDILWLLRTILIFGQFVFKLIVLIDLPCFLIHLAYALLQTSDPLMHFFQPFSTSQSSFWLDYDQLHFHQR